MTALLLQSFHMRMITYLLHPLGVLAFLTLVMKVILTLFRQHDLEVNWQSALICTLVAWLPVIGLGFLRSVMFPTRPVNIFPWELLLGLFLGAALVFVVARNYCRLHSQGALATAGTHLFVFGGGLIALHGLFGHMH